MPDSTSALINQLMNPPSPFAKAGEAIEGMNRLQQYKADAAAAEAYRQSIDENGNFDQAKFNRIASQTPGGSWNFGRQMQSSGEGLAAQARGGSADIQTKLDQQGAISTYLQPLTGKIFSGQPISGQEVSDLLATMPPGLIPPTRMKEIQGQLARIGPDGDATNLARGAMFSNQQAMDRLKAQLPVQDIYNQGTYGIPMQRNPLAPGGSTFPTRPIPGGPTAAESMQEYGILRGAVQGGWTDPVTGDHKEGSFLDWQKDHPQNATPPGVGALRPGPNGTFSFPGLPGEPPLTIIPAPQTREAPPGGGPRAPAPPATGGYRPPPPRGRGGPPEPSGYNTPQPQGGGTVVPSPRVIAAGEEAYTRDEEDMREAQPQRIFTLQQAASAMQGAKTGRGTEGLQTLNSLLGSWAPAWATKFAGVNPAEMAKDYDEAAKNYQNIANAAFPGGATTNDKLAAGIAGRPNVHMSDLAAKEITQILIAGEKMTQYFRQKARQEGVSPAAYQKYMAKQATDMDPRAFIIEHLPTDSRQMKELAAEINSGKPSGKKLRATIDQAVKDGAIPDPYGP